MIYYQIIFILSSLMVDHPSLITEERSPKATTYVFLSDECVITQYYVPTLNDIYETYGDQITFVAVFPNFSSKPKKIEAFYEKYKLQMPHQTDYYKKLCSRYGTTITPEVVVVNSTNDEILYQGRIDNSYAAIGKRRRVVTKHELSDALDAVIHNQKIPETRTEAIGCFINFKDEISSR